MTPAEIVKFIQGRRLSLSDEKRAQEDLAQEFLRCGIPAEREVRLNAVDIIDFMVGSVGIEMKLKAPRRAIYRQCERYCLHERVHALVLATNTALGMPDAINGKPVVIASLGRAWL